MTRPIPRHANQYFERLFAATQHREIALPTWPIRLLEIALDGVGHLVFGFWCVALLAALIREKMEPQKLWTLVLDLFVWFTVLFGFVVVGYAVAVHCGFFDQAVR